MIAGVATGIALRYDIDPVLVRVGFAVAAISGPGIPMYLFGCAVLPDGGSSGRNRLTVLLTTVLMLAATALVAGLLFTTDGSWLLTVAAAVALLVALHLSRGRRVVPAGAGGRSGDGLDGLDGLDDDVRDSGESDHTTASDAVTVPTRADAADPPAADAPTVAAAHPAGAEPAGGNADPTDGGPAPDTGPAIAGPDRDHDADHDGDHNGDHNGSDRATGSEPVAIAAAHPAGPTASAPAAPPPGVLPPAGQPPAWDPLGAAPFAWDLPEPSAPAPPPEPTSRLTPVTLAFALLAAGLAAVVGLTAPGSGLSLAAVPAAGLAVVGLGLVIGSFRHRGRWLIPFAVLLAALTWIVTAVPWSDLQGGVGTVSAAPTRVQDVDATYQRGIGDVTLDLTRLDLRTAPGTADPPVRTSARVGLGSITVVVPPDTDLTVRGDVGFGDLTLDRRDGDGSSNAVTVVDPGPDGPGGRAIVLDVHAGLGSVTVSRG